MAGDKDFLARVDEVTFVAEQQVEGEKGDEETNTDIPLEIDKTDVPKEREESGDTDSESGDELSSKARDSKAKTLNKQPTSKVEEPTKQISQGQDAELDNTEMAPKEEEPSIEMPQFWPADIKKAAAKADKEFVRKLVDRENQLQQWAYRVQSETDRAREVDKTLNEAFQPIKSRLLEHGLSPVQVAKRAAQWIELENTNPLQAAKAYVQKMGFSPEDLLREDGSEQYSNPQFDETREQLEQVKGELEAFKQQQQAREAQTINYELERFKSETDASGNPLRPKYEMVSHLMEQPIRQLKAQYPTMSVYDLLNYSYNYVANQLGINQTNGNGIPQKSKEQVLAEAKKAKNAASSVTGGPAASIASKDKLPRNKRGSIDLDAVIDRAIEMSGSNRA